jgi:putative ABC transport system permease protein
VAMAIGPRADEPVLTLGVECSDWPLLVGTPCPSAGAAQSTGPTPSTSAALVRLVGPKGYLLTDLGPVPLGHAPAVGALSTINDARVVVFPMAEAQALFYRPGKFDTIYVQPNAGISASTLQARLVRVVGPQNTVLSATDPPPGTAQTVGFLLPLLALIGIVSLALGAALTFNILGLAMEERRRELAVLGALGARPSTVRRNALVEAGLLGLVGGALGTALALVVAHILVGSISAQALQVYGTVLATHASPVVVLVGSALGVSVAVAAAWGPARLATRAELSPQLQQRGNPLPAPGRAPVWRAVIYTGIGFVGVGVCWTTRIGGGIYAWQPAVALVGLALGTGGSLLAIAHWAPFVTTALSRLVRRLSTSGTASLGALNMARQPRRAGSMATAVGMAVAVGTGLGSFLPSTQAVIADAYAPLTQGRVYVSTLGQNNTVLIDSKTSPATVAALARLPGVARVQADYFVATVAPGGVNEISVYSHGDSANLFPLVAGVPWSVARARGEVMIAPGLARLDDLHAGSVVRLATPTGSVGFKVGGIWVDPDNNGTTVTVTNAEIQRYWGPLPPLEVWAVPARGTTAVILAGRIRAANLAAGLMVWTSGSYDAALAASVSGMVSPFWVLQRVLLLIAFVSATATLLLIGMQRRREMGLLGAVGLGPRGRAKLTIFEGLAVGVTGSALGLLFSLGLIATLDLISGVLFGADPPFRVDVRSGLLYFAIGVAVMTAGAAWPAWRSSRISVIEALRYE